MRRCLLLLLLAAAATPSAAAAPAIAFPAAGTLQRDAVAVRAAPDPRARVVRVFHQFRRDFRPQIVLALGWRRGSDGRDWYRVSVPMRPNGRTGWIPAGSASVGRVHVRLVIRRGARTLTVFRDGRRVFSTRVAVGMAGAETPLGNFYVAARFEPIDPFYGPFALETSAYSRLSDWPGGGVVGIHGTSLPQLIGRAVSHGCVRVPNAAARRLEREVPLGSVIRIVPG